MVSMFCFGSGPGTYTMSCYDDCHLLYLNEWLPCCVLTSCTMCNVLGLGCYSLLISHIQLYRDRGNAVMPEKSFRACTVEANSVDKQAIAI